MRRARSLFNPFIALSDVTISMLVVITSLLMLFSAFVTASAQIVIRELTAERRAAVALAHAAVPESPPPDD